MRSRLVQHRERGYAVLIILVVLGLIAIFATANGFSRTSSHNSGDQATNSSLAQTKEALISYAISQEKILSAGRLPVPDVGSKPNEGESSANSPETAKNISVIGRFPWKTVGLPPPRDESGECLWYVVSGRFKNSQQTDEFNWDTQGQIDAIDEDGNPVASNLAALVVAPGAPLDSQNRALSDPGKTQCRGNFDARNYLDPYSDSDAVSGEINYFKASTNHQLAPDSSNKRFVLARNLHPDSGLPSHFNDRFLFITVDEIFRQVIRRNDFASQVSGLLNDPDLRAIAAEIAISADTRGTARLDANCGCSACSTKVISNVDNKAFCKNWKQMLFITQLPMPHTITVDGSPTNVCSRVMIFSGQRGDGQVRVELADKLAIKNYLEAQNADAFATPTAASTNFVGASTFNPNNPSADILRCIP